jgi:hypothetical protein
VVQLRRASVRDFRGSPQKLLAALTEPAHRPGPGYQPVLVSALLGTQPGEAFYFLTRAAEATQKVSEAVIPLPAHVFAPSLPARARVRALLTERLASDLSSSTEHEHEGEYGDEHDEEEAGDYCRCYRITRITVSRLNLGFLDDNFLKAAGFPKANRPYLEYAVERLLTYSPATDPDSYESSSYPGYYGDEVGAIHLTSEAQAALVDLLTPLLLTPDPAGLVFATLRAQYGHVLPQLQTLKVWTISDLAPAQVEQPASGHSAYLRPGLLQEYGYYPYGYNVAIGIAIRLSPTRVRLIDGRHRLAAQSKNKTVKLIVGS